MPHLLHIDSSVQGDKSVSRALSARAASAGARRTPAGRSPTATSTSVASFALRVELIEEIKQADTLLLGLPVYNFGPPSTVKSWVDHLIVRGLSIAADGSGGLLGDTEFIVLHARGGGYAAGTPREGWDHAEPWLQDAVSLTGLSPRFITPELTLAEVNPAMFDLKPLAAESLARAEAAVDELWAGVLAA